MTKPNNDRELLVELKHVLGAMSSQEACRNRLRLYGVRVPTGVCPSEALADYWRERIQAHLGDGFYETRQQLEELSKASCGSHRQHLGE